MTLIATATGHNYPAYLTTHLSITIHKISPI